jgi:hypothetical protein
MEKRVDLRTTKEIFPNSIAIVDYAFTLDGVDYFEVADFNSMTSDRAFNCLTYYEENKSHCTYDYLMTFSQALDDVVNNNAGIKLTDVVKLNIQLKERLQFLSYAETAYKLCSVVYFDASENPNKYDFVKGAKKATIFKEKGLSDFFLQTPITKLIPALGLSANDLREYLEMVSLINEKHIRDISTMLSEQSKSSEYYKRLISQVEKDLV